MENECANKTLMILGSLEDARNIVIYEEAKKLGVICLVCSDATDQKTKTLSDIFYEVDYKDIDKLEEIALKHNVNGVIGAFDNVVLCCARLCERLDLPCNSSDSVMKLLKKSDFRQLQYDNFLFAPKSIEVDNLQKAFDAVGELKLPVIIKPQQASASKGHTVVRNFDKKIIEDAFNICQYYSRDNKVNVEEYIEPSSLAVVECDPFLYDNQFI